MINFKLKFWNFGEKRFSAIFRDFPRFSAIFRDFPRFSAVFKAFRKLPRGILVELLAGRAHEQLARGWSRSSESLPPSTCAPY